MEIIEKRKRQREQVIVQVSEFIKGLNFKCTALRKALTEYSADCCALKQAQL